MKDQNCIFCKIIAGEIPYIKIREDDDFVAILDVFPNRKGMTLVISKDHYDSDIFTLDDDLLAKYMKATKKVVALLKKGLQVDRVGVLIEGLDVNHSHIKLYPFYNGMGFQTGTGQGPKEDMENLKKVAQEIKDNQ